MGKENIYRYPLAPHLLSHWNRGKRKGQLKIRFGKSGDLLVFDYVQYTPPEYFLGEHYLGTATLNGKILHVTEKYRYETVTNSGRVKWNGSARSEEGLCACSELIMADDAGRAIEMSEAERGLWNLAAGADVDQSFHESDIENYRCKGSLDVGALTLVLERSYFRDSST